MAESADRGGFMRLEEKLKEYNGSYVKVGAKEGSAFVYCGICDDSMPELLTKLSAIQEKNINKYLYESRKHLENFDSFWAKKIMKRLEVNSKPNTKMKKIPEDVLLEKLKKEKEIDRERTKRRIEKYKRLKKEFTPFNEREFVESYPSVIEEDEYIILFKGEEDGIYWVRSDWKGIK